MNANLQKKEIHSGMRKAINLYEKKALSLEFLESLAAFYLAEEINIALIPRLTKDLKRYQDRLLRGTRR